MLTRLVQLSVRFRGIAIALACLVIGYGLYITSVSKFDVFPEFAPPQVVIQTEAPGLSPEEVEALVTSPVENAVNGVGGLETIISQSIQGLSVVTVTFQEGTDIYRARQLVAEALSEAHGAIPQGVAEPRLAPLTSAASTVLTIGLTSEALSPMALRTFADWTLRPRLLGVPGVAKLSTFGGEVRQLQVQVNPQRLIAFGMSISDVLDAARKSTGVRGAGFMEGTSQRLLIQTQGQSLTPADLGQVIVAHHNGGSVRLCDVATIADAPAPPIGAAQINGVPGVAIVISSQYGSNTAEVTSAIDAALAEMQPALKDARITLHDSLFRPANFIHTSIGNVRNSLLIGGILVAVVLFFFLYNVRTAFISITAIPLSLLIGVIVLHYFGISLNTLTLGGLAIAIGEVVDDAIIDVENIFRRLRQNRANGNSKSVFQVVVDASVEVRSAVIYATFVVVLVFIPVLTMGGIEGRLFAPLGLAYIFAILASLLVALTVTPAMCYLLLARHATGASEPPFVGRLKNAYMRWLEAVVERPRAMLLLIGVLAVYALISLPFFERQYMPEFSEGQFLLHMSAVPGTSMEESLRLGRQVTAELLKHPKIRSIAQRVGRAEVGDDVSGSQDSEFDVALNPVGGEEGEQVQADIRNTLNKYPGAYFSVTQFLSERIEETLSGVTAQVAIKIYGDDLDVIDQKAQEIVALVQKIDGAADVQLQSARGMPRMLVQLRRDRLKQLGFQPVEVMEAIQTAYEGSDVTQIYEGNRVFDVAVILAANQRRDPSAIGALLMRNAEGQRIALKELADIRQDAGRYSIIHEGARRRQAVTCNVRGRGVASFVAEARRRIEESVKFPSGVYAVYAGAAEAQQLAQKQLLVHSALVAVAIVLLLAIVLGSTRNLLLVLVNLPLALIGGVVAVFATGGILSIGTMVGFVTLFGITTRNSIMLISHYEHLVNEEGQEWNAQTAVRGASERLIPILMTALVTGLGLLPIAIGTGEAGREIEGPMAIVILGGLATSTALNLLVLPTLAYRYARFSRTPASSENSRIVRVPSA
jgi:CzcA family heavy metal efflux pump